MKEIEQRIQTLKKEGKNQEAEFLEKTKHQITYFWQISHIWIYLWQKRRNIFWGLIMFFILLIILGIL